MTKKIRAWYRTLIARFLELWFGPVTFYGVEIVYYPDFSRRQAMRLARRMRTLALIVKDFIEALPDSPGTPVSLYGWSWRSIELIRDHENHASYSYLERRLYLFIRPDDEGRYFVKALGHALFRDMMARHRPRTWSRVVASELDVHIQRRLSMFEEASDE